jgi:hypothetical protein
MEHPLIPSLDNLTVDELGSKITELHKKLAMATKTGNGNLCNQIRMAIESYQTKYSEKLQEQYKNSGGSNFNDKINIS